MTTEELYKHIDILYNNFDFKSKLLIDNLLIIGNENYYQVYLNISDNHKLQFKISKQYSIIKNTYYIFHYEITHEKESESYHDLIEFIPKKVVDLILPTIRDFKLKILNNDTDNQQTIFEHCI
jgi:hypothetical protein